jgi:hypothetical protein
MEGRTPFAAFRYGVTVGLGTVMVAAGVAVP